MAFAFKAPNVVSTVAAPQVNIPESARSHAGEIALSAGLASINDVAKIYRDHQDAVTQAGAMAELLDASGMPDEANAYRKAASTFRPNFFSDPQSANSARKAMLNDAMSIIGNKYKREKDAAELALRKEELGITRDYRESMASAALKKADQAVADAEARLAAAKTREEQQQIRIELERLKFSAQLAQSESNAAIYRMNAETAARNAETRARAQQFKEYEFNTQQEAFNKAMEEAKASGAKALPLRAGVYKWVDRETGEVKVTATVNSDQTWTVRTSGIPQDKAGDYLPGGGRSVLGSPDNPDTEDDAPLPSPR